MISDFRKRMFARYYDRVAAKYDAEMSPRKLALMAGMRGQIVEIGPGTGSNLALLPAGVSWIGIEPNRHMHAQLLEKAEGLGIEADLRLLDADRLPFEDSSVDHVLSTLVMCSVPDPSHTLAEIHRVLKPGGSFVFWEHVIAPDSVGLRCMQHMLNPMQRALADGCRTNRDLARDIRAAGFAEVNLEEFRLPKHLSPPWIRPHIAGEARR